MISEIQVVEHFKSWAGLNSPDIYVTHEHIKAIQVRENLVFADVEVGYPCLSQTETIRSTIETYLKTLHPSLQVQLNIKIVIVPHKVRHGLKLMPGVKNIIAVASGKGGVGKSTTAVNIALALQREGASVGILDADIYGPSIPTMLRLEGKPSVEEGEKGWWPLTAYGIEAISIGVLIEEDTPMVWRGPMVTSALEQLLRETRWRNLDYLVVDLPPGTGDIQLTLSQKVPLSGAVIVTTPQDIALLDVKKGLKMFEKVNVPILGIIENMSLHTCSQCGHTEAIFGSGGGHHLAEDYNAPFLGQLPLDIKIREHSDSGTPIVISDPLSPITQAYINLARRMSIQLAHTGREFSHKFPQIIMQ
ncbi:MAG: iron-sulfur cluster carrier protein ApbC [Pseudomonadota bacterium]